MNTVNNLLEIAEMVAAEVPLSDILARIQLRMPEMDGIVRALVVPMEQDGAVDCLVMPPLELDWTLWEGRQWHSAIATATRNPGEICLVPGQADTWVVTLFDDQAISGLMLVRTNESRQVSHHVLADILSPWIKIASIAVRHARHQKVEQDAAKRAEKLAQLARAIKITTPLIDFTRLVRAAVVESRIFDRAGIFLVSKDKQWLEGCWGTDRSGKEECLQDQRWPRPTTEDDFLWSVATGQEEYILIEDYASMRGLPDDHFMSGVRHHAILGLRVGGEVVGELCVDNLLSGRPITTADIRLVMPFLDQTAVAISNARLIEALEETHQTLVRAERMEAMATTASEIAHSLNNTLTRVIGSAEILQEQPNQSPDVKMWTDRIVFAAEEAADTVRRLQNFSKPMSGQGESVVDFGQIVHKALSVMTDRFEQCGIKLSIDTGTTAPVRVRHDDGIETVCGLLSNACDAMPSGGELHVALRIRGKAVELEITDTGTGIEPDLVSKVMEPFVTTRQAQGHLGLGLSNVWRCVERWQGKVQISSEIGTGTTVRLTIPLAAPV